VSGGNLDRLGSEQLTRDESLPFRREELIVAREDQRRRDFGMFGQWILPDRNGSGSSTLC
jgi:hypothetical protein